jgi:hypothetical protein
MMANACLTVFGQAESQKVGRKRRQVSESVRRHVSQFQAQSSRLQETACVCQVCFCLCCVFHGETQQEPVVRRAGLTRLMHRSLNLCCVC